MRSKTLLFIGLSAFLSIGLAFGQTSRRSSYRAYESVYQKQLESKADEQDARAVAAEARAKDAKGKAAEAVREKGTPEEVQQHQMELRARQLTAEAEAAQARAEAAKIRANIAKDRTETAKSQAAQPGRKAQTKYYDSLWFKQVQEKSDAAYKTAQLEATQKTRLAEEATRKAEIQSAAGKTNAGKEAIRREAAERAKAEAAAKMTRDHKTISESSKKTAATTTSVDNTPDAAEQAKQTESKGDKAAARKLKAQQEAALKESARKVKEGQEQAKKAKIAAMEEEKKQAKLAKASGKKAKTAEPIVTPPPTAATAAPLTPGENEELMKAFRDAKAEARGQTGVVSPPAPAHNGKSKATKSKPLAPDEANDPAIAALREKENEVQSAKQPTSTKQPTSAEARKAEKLEAKREAARKKAEEAARKSAEEAAAKQKAKDDAAAAKKAADEAAAMKKAKKAGKEVNHPSTTAAAPADQHLSEKEQKLADLLRRYKNDEITPTEYHTQRAKIMAEP